MKVTTEDLLEAMRAALAQPKTVDDALTGPELMEYLNVGRPKFVRCLKQMLAAGQAEVVIVRRPGMDGRNMTLRAYRLKAAA